MTKSVYFYATLIVIIIIIHYELLMRDELHKLTQRHAQINKILILLNFRKKKFKNKTKITKLYTSYLSLECFLKNLISSSPFRYYYKSKVLQPVLGRRLVYKFGPTAHGWRTSNPNFVN